MPELKGNIALTAPYNHSSGVWSLEQAVTNMGSSQLVAFLRTLTGKLPQGQLPELPLETADTPKPPL